MTALTGDAIRRQRNTGGKSYEEYEIATSAVIYVGSLVTKRKGTTLRARAAVATTTDVFVGVAETGGTGNAGGTVVVRVAYGHEVLIDASTTVSASLIGSDVVVADDNMVTSVGASSSDLRIGEYVETEGGDAWVRVRNHSRTDS